MNVTKNLIGAAVLVALAGVGCSTPAYQPLGEDVGASGGDVGYRSKLVSRDEMLVYYRGKQGMSLGDAVELAKVRAAELARAEGHDRFTVVNADREVEKEVDYVPAYGVGYGPAASTARPAASGRSPTTTATRPATSTSTATPRSSCASVSATAPTRWPSTRC